jgi:hypothetical protein
MKRPLVPADAAGGRARRLSALLVSALALVHVLALAGCGGGQYSPSTERYGHSQRGETNGRMFDYVAMTADGDQWEVRVRGTAMWVAYSLEDKTESFAPVNLGGDESAKIWKLVDAIDLPSRRRGHIDEKNGTILLRLREPGDDDHDIYTVYFSREAENQKVGSLASYLITLVKKYHGEKPPL